MLSKLFKIPAKKINLSYRIKHDKQRRERIIEQGSHCLSDSEEGPGFERIVFVSPKKIGTSQGSLINLKQLN